MKFETGVMWTEEQSVTRQGRRVSSRLGCRFCDFAIGPYRARWHRQDGPQSGPL